MFFFRLKSQTEQLSSNFEKQVISEFFGRILRKGSETESNTSSYTMRRMEYLLDNSIHNTEMPNIPIPNIELKLVNTYYFPPLSRQYASNRELMSLDINTNNPNKACFY